VRTIVSLLGLFYFMEFLEKDLEEIIYTSERGELFDRGLSILGKLYRQFKVGNYGIADLIELQRPLYHTYFKKHEKGVIYIYELKLNNVSPSSFLQAVRYAKGVHSYLNKRGIAHLFDIEIVLIGNKVDLESSFVYLADLFMKHEGFKFVGDDIDTYLSIYGYKYSVSGITFQRHVDYTLINDGFSV
jgi:hypothetical protein